MARTRGSSSPMLREQQGKVDSPFGSSITLRYCTKEEHHLLTPLPQHLICSCCEPARVSQAHRLLLHPRSRVFARHPQRQRSNVSSQQNALIPLVQAGDSMAQHWVACPRSDRLLLRPQRLLTHLFPCRMQTAFCKPSELKGIWL